MTGKEFTEQEQAEFDRVGVPTELRCWLSYLAHEQGHSGGYQEVLNCLYDLLNGFTTAWKNYLNNNA